MLNLIDGNNIFRRRFEVIGAQALTAMYHEACLSFGANQTIWVWDAKDSKIRRKKVYPDYKGGRSRASDEFYQTVNLFKKLLTHSRCLQITVPTYEADDVIATLALDTASKVTIHSNDVDFASLTSDRISTEMERELPTDAENMRLYKTFVGDKSDNIPGMANFGDGAFKKLTADQIEELHCFIEGRTDEPDFEFLGWTENRIEKFNACKSDLYKYWEIVELLSVPLDELAENIIVPQYDTAAANLIFKSLYLPTL